MNFRTGFQLARGKVSFDCPSRRDATLDGRFKRPGVYAFFWSCRSLAHRLITVATQPAPARLNHHQRCRLCEEYSYFSLLILKKRPRMIYKDTRVANCMFQFDNFRIVIPGTTSYSGQFPVPTWLPSRQRATFCPVNAIHDRSVT